VFTYVEIYGLVAIITILMMIDCAILLFALIRMASMLKKTSVVKLNLWYMIMHITIMVMLSTMAILTVLVNFTLDVPPTKYLYINIGYDIVYFILNILFFIVLFKGSRNLVITNTEKIEEEDLSYATRESSINIDLCDTSIFTQEQRGDTSVMSMDIFHSMVLKKDSFAGSIIASFTIRPDSTNLF
jgi:hypothetical protein